MLRSLSSRLLKTTLRPQTVIALARSTSSSLPSRTEVVQHSCVPSAEYKTNQTKYFSTWLGKPNVSNLPREGSREFWDHLFAEQVFQPLHHPSAPAFVGFADIQAGAINTNDNDDEDDDDCMSVEFDYESSMAVRKPNLRLMNRNNRRLKRANNGARPCSRRGRRARKNAIGKRRR